MIPSLRSFTASAFNMYADGPEQTAKKIGFQQLEKQLFPSPYLALTLACDEITKLCINLCKGNIPTIQVRKDTARVLGAYIASLETPSTVKNNSDLKKLIEILLDEKALLLVDENPQPSGIDLKNSPEPAAESGEKIGKKLQDKSTKKPDSSEAPPQPSTSSSSSIKTVDLGGRVDKTVEPLLIASYNLIRKEYDDRGGIIAKICHSCLWTLTSWLRLEGMDVYEPGHRYSLLSSPQLDAAHRTIDKLRAASSEPTLVARQQLSKELRELAPSLSDTLNKSSIAQFCDLLESEEKLNTEKGKTLVTSVSNILQLEAGTVKALEKLNTAYRTLNEMREGIQDIRHTLQERQKLAENLGNFAKLTKTNNSDLTSLCTILEKPEVNLNAPENITLIESVYQLIKKEHDYQTGPVEKIIEIVFTKFNRWVVGALKTRFHPSESKAKTEYYRTLFESKKNLQQQEASVVDIRSETEHQISLLKTNISRMVLGHIACYFGKISPKDQEGDWIIRHMSAPNASYVSEINRRIEEADASWLRKQLTQLSCKILEPLLSYYINHFITHITQEIQNWIDLPPARQLETVVQTLIDPIGDYLTTLIKISINLRKTIKEPITHQIPAYFEKEVANLQKNEQLDLSLKQLTGQLIDNIFKHPSSFNWAEKASTQFKEKAKKEPLPHNKLWWSGWSRFFNTLSYPVSWTQKIVDKTLYFVFKNALRKIFQSFLNSSEKKTNYIYLINNFIRENLQKINTESSSLKTTTLGDDESSNDIPKKIGDKIFNVLELTGQMVALQTQTSDATSFFKGQESLIANLKDATRQEILSLAKPLILNQVIPILQTITNPHQLKSGWLDFLKRINEVGFNTTSTKPLVDPTAVEHAMYNELEIFLQEKIGKTINDLNDPKESLQRIVTGYFEASKKKLTKMKIQELSIEDIISSWEKIVSWRKNRTTHLESVLNKENIDPIYLFNKEFIIKSKLFESKINALRTATNDLWKNEIIWTEHKSILKILDPDSPKVLYDKKSIQKLQVSDEIKNLINQLIKSKDKHQNGAFIVKISALINSHIGNHIKTNASKLQKEIEKLTAEVINAFSTLSRWATSQKPPEVHAPPSLILGLLSPLLANPTTNSFLITVAKNNSDAILGFVRQDYHYPTVLQFILRGYLKKV